MWLTQTLTADRQQQTAAEIIPLVPGGPAGPWWPISSTETSINHDLGSTTGLIWTDFRGPATLVRDKWVTAWTTR